jgi:hypothetical protein
MIAKWLAIDPVRQMIGKLRAAFRTGQLYQTGDATESLLTAVAPP